MAEEDSELELDRFKKELESLLNTSAGDERGLQSKLYCARFCELVEDHTGRWQVPLPQLQVLRSALCAFVRGAASFPFDCEHVRYTLSSIALSVFELLLFFGKDEFPEDPLKYILDSFQECHSSLVRYQNVYLLQVRQIIRDGGPWASPVLQGILKELEQPQEEVERYLSSELSIFFELRVRYLVACERTQEAMALSQRCSRHLTAGRHLFFKQAYLTCLWKTSEHERLLKEVAEMDGKDAVEILCMAEKEEKDEVLLGLSRSHLLQQLLSGDMYYLWELVFIWGKLFLRTKSSKEEFLEECKLMILSATNIKALFPFIKVIMAELGQDGLTFCLELCARALQTDLKNDPVTKSLIYKTIAHLLPNDLEVCRACALLVFFLERTVEAYKTVFLLYNHPDQEYHLDSSPIGNHVRFELIQILKKGLFFDPEFWSLLNIRTNCLKLMSDKVAKAVLCEIMEDDKWTPNCCDRGQCKCHMEPDRTVNKPVAKPISKPESETVDKQVRSLSEDPASKVPLPKKRGRKPGSKILKDPELCPVRRSFRQLDLAQNHARQLSNRHQRFLTRQSEKKTLKRRGRKPRWLQEELAAQAENSAPRQGKKPGRKPKQLNVVKDISIQTPVIEITMEISYPDNEVDLPPDQGWPVCKMTLTAESNFKESKSPCQGFSMQPHAETSNSLLQILSEESTSSWGEAAKDSQEYVFWLHDDLAFVRKFHTYAKVPEEEGISTDALTADSVVAMSAHAVEQERPFQSPTHVNDPCEPVEEITQVVTEVTLFTPASTQDVSAPIEVTVEPHGLELHPRQESLLVTPVEDSLVADGIVGMLENGTVDSPKDETSNPVADTIPPPENAPEIAVCTPDRIDDRATDICTSENGSAKTNDTVHEVALNTVDTTPAPEIVPHVTPATTSAPEHPPVSMPVCDSHENTAVAPKEPVLVSENASVMAREHKTVASLAEEQPRGPEEDQAAESEPPQDRCAATSTHSPQTVVRLLHRCGLCNKECKNSSVLRHALWHYRTERKCMFCHCFNYVHGPLCHFKKHIKDLREGLTKVSDKPGQVVPRALPKKTRPGLAQIKSRLLMKLNVRREPSPQHKAENSLDGHTLKQKFKKKSESTQELEKGKEEKKGEDEESIPKTKVRYLTRGLVRKSQPKGKLPRTRLARKAKTRVLTTDVSDPKDGLVNRANGVIRKARKLKHSQEESWQENGEKNVPPITKPENDEQESTADSETDQVEAGGTNKEGIRSTWANAEEEAALQTPGIKKKNRLADQKEDGTSATRRKVDIGRTKRSGADQKHKENSGIINPSDGTEQENVAAGETNAIDQENGAKLNESSKVVKKKKVSGAPLVRCPVEACTFLTRPSPVLSHVLIHHPGDTKALEFFYTLAKEKCLFCSRRIWSPQHFFDHVVSHRGNLKHPCYHVDCKERFKTRLKLGDHMLKDHHPLRATCCFPGCAGQFANPKLLYSHERIHYKVVRKKTTPKKDKSLTSTVKKEEKVSATASSPNTTTAEIQQLPENLDTAPSQTQLVEGAEQTRSATPVKAEDEKPLMLNRGSVSYATKSPRLVNGHGKHGREARAKPATAASKEQEMEYGKMSNKPFVRPPPSAYLDESYISMPKRWKGPQVSPRDSTVSVVISPTKRQCCSRCSASFDTEEELQAHRGKCTSLFGFDSDDESAS